MTALVGSGFLAKTVLEQWLRFDPGLAELTGASGMGKSAVADALIDDDLRLIRLAPPLTPDVALTTLARQLGVTPGEVRSTIAQIRQQARTARDGGFHTLVVLDQADQVDDAVLALLARIAGESDDGQGLAVLMLAHESLRARVRSVSSPSMQINDISLVELTDEEADELIQMRLNDGPWQGDGALQLDRKALIAAAAGNPGSLVELLTQARAGLPVGKSAKKPRPSKKVAKSEPSERSGRTKVIALFSIGVLLALAAGAFFVLQLYQQDTADSIQIDASSAIQAASAAASFIPEQTPSGEPEKQPAAPVSGTLAALAELEQEVKISSPAPSPPRPDPVADVELTPEDLQDLPPVESASIDLTQLDSAAPSEADTVSNAEAQAPPLASAVIVISPPQTQPQESETVGESTGIVNSDAVRSFALDEAEILSRAPNSFTLQVLGSRNVDLAVAEKARLSVLLNASVVKVQHQGAPWYVLVLGNFDSREAATQAGQNLPPELIQRGFWARTVRGLQEQINEVNP